MMNRILLIVVHSIVNLVYYRRDRGVSNESVALYYNGCNKDKLTNMMISTVGLTILDGVDIKMVYLTGVQKSWVKIIQQYGYSAKLMKLF